ncbi:MAG: Bacillibactin transport regulator [Verrucomicrobiota bacterium]|jgi:AraC-like DNA-binding protein
MSDTRKDLPAWRPLGVKARQLIFFALWDVDATAAYFRDWPQRPLVMPYQRHLEKFHSWVIVRTLSGAGLVTLKDGRQLKLGAGSFVAFPLAELWSYGADGGDWVFRWFDFSGDERWPREVRNIVAPPLEGVLIESLQRLMRAGGDDNGETAAASFALLTGLWRSALLPSFGGEESSRQRVQAQIEQIRTHPGLDWRLTEMSAACAVTESRLREMFAEISGEGPREFIQRCRMEEAARRLTFGRVELHRIAADLGYQHQSHFTRAFKLWHGVSPSAYRRGV